MIWMNSFLIASESPMAVCDLRVTSNSTWNLALGYGLGLPDEKTGHFSPRHAPAVCRRGHVDASADATARRPTGEARHRRESPVQPHRRPPRRGRLSRRLHGFVRVV